MVSDSMSLDEIISALYRQFLVAYRDNKELASLATAVAVDDLLEQNRFATKRQERGCDDLDQ